MSIPEYRSVLRTAFLLLEELKTKRKAKCDNEIGGLRKLEVQLSELCSAITLPHVVEHLKQKLYKIRKKRGYKRKLRLNKLCYKNENAKLALEQNKEIDIWMNSIKEKDLQRKREIEMKMLADNILGEVRKKILEAKRTIEKLNVLEKLRKDRRNTSLQRGLYASSKNDVQFYEKLSTLKEVMQIQLNDYEAEEKALSVMLETEHEDQREEELARRLRKLKQLQEKKKSNILQCLFGDAGDQLELSDPMFLFRQYYMSGYDSIENMLQIRCQWDSFLVSPGCVEGSTIPRQWVLPEAPSSELWEAVLMKQNS